MNRIDRLTAILIHLQGKSRVPIDELEDRFGVGRRTIFRDIKALMESGVPIGGDAGEGYFIVEGYRLPPVMFSREEAASLLLAAKLINQNADAETNKLVSEAMLKIRSVLKYSDRDFLETLENKVEILASPMNKTEGFPDSNINQIQTALVAKKVLDITYYSNYNDSTTKRKVEPLGLVYYSSRWHMIGFCQMRQDLRDFRTDRIQRLNISNEEFDPDDHPDFLKFTRGMTEGSDAKEATILFSKDVVRYISEQRFHYGFIEEKITDEGIEMKFITPRYEFVAQWIMMFSTYATVISPPELQGMVAQKASETFDHHKKYFEPAKIE